MVEIRVAPDAVPSQSTLLARSAALEVIAGQARMRRNVATAASVTRISDAAPAVRRENSVLAREDRAAVRLSPVLTGRAGAVVVTRALRLALRWVAEKY